MTTPRRPVNKSSSRLRPVSGETTVRRRTARVTAGQSGNRATRTADEAAAERTVRYARNRADYGARRLPSPASSFRRVFGRNPSGGPGPSWGLAIGLLAAAVVVTAVAVVAALRPGVDDGNKAFVDTQATQQVTAAADNALKTIYSYDVKTIGGYKDAVHKVVTGKMLSDFDKFADTTVSAVQQAQSTATATPDPIGVTLLTSDRAEMLVDLTVAATKNGVPQESASGPIVLRMQKIGGHWLASEIADR
jgi:Mce-associated membrane protein